MMIRLQEEGNKRARDIVEIGPYSLFCLHFSTSMTNLTQCHLMGTQSPHWVNYLVDSFISTPYPEPSVQSDLIPDQGVNEEEGETDPVTKVQTFWNPRKYQTINTNLFRTMWYLASQQKQERVKSKNILRWSFIPITQPPINNSSNVVCIFHTPRKITQGWGELDKLMLISPWDGAGISKGFAFIRFRDLVVEQEVSIRVPFQLGAF